MKLGMSQTQRMELTCTVCGRSMSDHDPECPAGKRTEWAKSLMLFECNRCLKSGTSRGCVEANTDDFLECRKCHTVYNRGASHEDGLETVLLFKVGYETFKDLIEVTVFRVKGKGKFKSDVVLKRFRDEEARWKRERRGQ